MLETHCPHSSADPQGEAQTTVTIGELYRIEAEVRGHSAEERRTVRQERSRLLVNALHAWLIPTTG